MHPNIITSMIVNFILFINLTTNLSITNNPNGTMLKIHSISIIILSAEPTFGGTNSLYTLIKIKNIKNNAVAVDIKVGFRVK